jgi:putative FmdB family regulatory protein
VPLYEYQCLPHGHRFEVRHGMNESPIEACSECGGKVRRVIHPVGIVFKGSGFYATDSRASSAKSKSMESANSESRSKDASSSESTSTEAKPDSKAEPAPAKPAAKSEGSKETPAAR